MLIVVVDPLFSATHVSGGFCVSGFSTSNSMGFGNSRTGGLAVPAALPLNFGRTIRAYLQMCVLYQITLQMSVLYQITSISSFV